MHLHCLCALLVFKSNLLLSKPSEWAQPETQDTGAVVLDWFHVHRENTANLNLLLISHQPKASGPAVSDTGPGGWGVGGRAQDCWHDLLQPPWLTH